MRCNRRLDIALRVSELRVAGKTSDFVRQGSAQDTPAVHSWYACGTCPGHYILRWGGLEVRTPCELCHATAWMQAAPPKAGVALSYVTSAIKEHTMQTYNVHIYREMRLFFPGTVASTAEEAARLAAEMPSGAA
jgi:hypothetical protein